MKIEYRTGNLFDGADVKFLAHCCNARGRMGSGFAKELRSRYPGAYEAYSEAHKDGGLTMGETIPYNAPDGRIIFNIIGQNNYGYDGARYVSYDALTTALENIDNVAKDYDIDNLFMPLMGASLAGGSWQIISAIIERHSVNYQPVVYLFDGKLPNS